MMFKTERMKNLIIGKSNHPIIFPDDTHYVVCRLLKKKYRSKKFYTNYETVIEKSELKVSSILKLHNFLFSLTTLQTERIYVETHNFIFRTIWHQRVYSVRIQFSELIDDGKNYFFTTSIMEKSFEALLYSSAVIFISRIPMIQSTPHLSV